MNKLYWIGLLIFLVFLVRMPGKSESATSEPSSKAKKVKWYSFNEGLALAEKENKSVLVDFYTSWCHWCKEMDEKTFSDPRVARRLKEKFVPVRLDAESTQEKVTYKGKTYSNADLTQAFGVRGFPTIGFLDHKGEPITIVPGFVPAETFVYMLEYIDKECYKNQMSFEEFVEKKGDCSDQK